ncbi:ribosome maturation factor RimM [Williamsia sterculiae]|uniref:Ribosome maturation factor RimM n=1 Tax=Williamsia sterculiae TaxID=1344003 RepID=A0A1N7GIF7_9NOCA|nr:ribosome maturation factor RimM [Williamsia sterculiae]SIS12383.1 16S rRNA processing protein RimM [Williamsia sterculiae]
MDLVVGRVVKSHGVRGELVVDVRTDDPEDRFAVGATLRGYLPRRRGATDTGRGNPAERTFTVTAARPHGARLLLSLAEVADRASADDLRGWLFVIDAAAVDSGDDPDEFYDHELQGVEVVTTVGDRVGEVRDILHLPANDVLVVTRDAGDEVLVPFVTEVVPTVGREHIVIDPPEGLLEAPAGDAGGTGSR